MSKFRHLMNGSLVKAVMLVAVSCIISGFVNCESKIPRASGPITQEIYIWQRYWNGQVQDSLASAPVRLAGLVQLGAEVTFSNDVPTATFCEPDYQYLTEYDVPVGLVLRIGPWSGPFSENDELAVYLATLASDLVTRAKDSGVEISELQIDFDCAEAALDGYTLWVRAIRSEIEPTPLIITALPCWLKHREFRQLAEISDGYVLQVHSIERPQGPDDDFTLCDPVRSLNWIEQAAEIGLPFRVALPTYGYHLEFDSEGEFRRLFAEGPSIDWPEDAILREVRSNPSELADLVASLIEDRPENLGGLIWYRLPVETDRLNWPWKTLAAVMEGREPRALLAANILEPEPGLVDIELSNDGETVESTDVLIMLNWQDARLMAFDCVNGFELVAGNENSASLKGSASIFQPGIKPDESRIVGWFRFDRDTEVVVDVSPIQD